MSNKIELNELTQVIHKEHAFLVALNENFDRIQEALNDTVSRTEKTPNQMEGVLDMNGHRIINVNHLDPDNPNDPNDEAITRKDIQDLIDEVNRAVSDADTIISNAIIAIQTYVNNDVLPILSSSVTDAQAAMNSAKGYAQDAKGYYDDTKTMYDALADLASSVDELLIVYANLSNITTLASNISDVNTCASNIAAIQGASINAADAAASALAAADSAALAAQYGNDKINQTHVTNVVTDIPQNLSVSLSSGTLTVEAGSKFYIPNGDNTFDLFTLPNNSTHTASDVTPKQKLVVFNRTTYTLQSLPVSSCYSGSTAPTGFADNAIWYDTTNNVIKYSNDAGSTWINTYSLPLALISVGGGTITGIDQVFNGFGFIGNTVFSLPGIKGIIPDGRNPDGSLKSTAITTTKVLLNTISGSGIYHIMLTTNSLDGFANVFYDLNKNILYNNGNPQISRVDCGIIKRVSGGVVSEIYPKKVLDVFDRSTEAQEDFLKGMSLNLKKDFGARGNNVDDDTDALQKAFDYCVENNKTLYIPAGTYKISSVETKKTYATDERKCLKIVGTSGTILNVSGSITIGNHLTQYIQDLFINGTSKTAAAVVIGNDDAAYNGYYKGVRIMGDPLAVYFKHAFDIGFEDCRFISQNHYEEPVDIQPTMKFGKGSAEWDVDQSPNCITFTRCQWEGTGGNGAQVYFSDENSVRSYVISFLGCHFETRNRNSRAFYIESGQTIGFYNCTFTNNDYMGGTDTHTRVPNYIKHAEGVDIVNCTFDRYLNKLIEFGDTNVKFLNILANTQQAYEPTETNPDGESYKDLSTFFTLVGNDTTSWHCSIHNGLSLDEVYEYGNVYGKPGLKFTDLTIGASGTSYVANADGYYNFEMNSGASGERVKMICQRSGGTRQIAVSEFSSDSGQLLSVIMPASRGDQVVIIYNTTGAAGKLRRVNSKGTY